MTDNKVKDMLEKLEVKDLKSGGAEIRLNDKNNYVAIRIAENGKVDRIHLDVVGLTEFPIMIKN